jgi:hypothetical protein
MYWDLNKAAFDVARGGYRKAQHVGMRFQNWRHRGAGEGTGITPAEAAATEVSRPVGKKGQQWSSVDETTSMTSTQTYYHHVKKKK